MFTLPAPNPRGEAATPLEPLFSSAIPKTNAGTQNSHIPHPGVQTRSQRAYFNVLPLRRGKTKQDSLRHNATRDTSRAFQSRL